MKIAMRQLAKVVPARAGMSPGGLMLSLARYCGPRASGDEPGNKFFKLDNGAWSPRERG